MRMGENPKQTWGASRLGAQGFKEFAACAVSAA